MTDHIVPEIEAYLDGELSEGRRARVETHTRDCGACREAVAEAEALRKSIRDDAPPELSGSVWPDVRDRLARERATRPRFLLATAAALVVGILLGAVVPSGTADEETSQWPSLGSTGLSSTYFSSGASP